MNSPTKDQLLWQLFRQGDKQSLGSLVECYYRMLKHYGLKFMVDEAVVEDCIQELFLQLWQNRTHINDTESVKHYLLKALRNHILMHLRLKKRLATEELDCDYPLGDSVNFETELIQKESLQEMTSLIQKQLADLPTREREALYLRFYENLSIPEIAEVMQINRQSVSNFLHKALGKLRNQWVTHSFLALCVFFQENFL